MKNLLLFTSVIIGISILLSSCSEPKNNTVTIIGNGFVFEEDPMAYLIDKDDIQIHGQYSNAVDSTTLNKDGSFLFQYETEESEFYQIVSTTNKNLNFYQPIYLSPGDTLIINNSDDIDSISFGGNARHQHQIIFDLAKTFEFGDENRKAQHERINKEAKELVEYFAETKAKKIEFLEQQEHYANMPDAQKDYILANIKNKEVSYYFHYLRLHNYYTKEQWKPISYDSFPHPFLSSFELNENEYYWDGEFAQALNGYVENKLESETAVLPDSLKWHKRFNRNFNIIKRELSGPSKDVALAKLSTQLPMLINTDTSHFFETLDEMHGYFKDNHTEKRFYDFFKKNYDKLVNIKPGSPAPDFSLPDSTGQLVSLSDFKGKVVFMDFWGTWCPPCIEAIPDHLALQKKLEGEDVVFLNIAMEYNENDIDRWKKFIKKKNFTGTNVVAEKQFANEEIAPYSVSSAPSYVLIDKAGNIAAPRASSPKHAEEEIRKLLE